MATLNWIGKEAVVNHDKEVPFKLLEKVPSASVGKESKNLIIHGDNLEALKALMPFYKGKVKCIYIDPPYNTGKEKWVYNDNVNSAKIRQWIGKVVGAESEDLTRHDKWLCMMYPRLKLLHDLLHNDGVIFVSIDDNELSNLQILMDEIFERKNFIANFIHKNNSSKNQANLVSISTEYMLVYSKNKEALKGKIWRINKKGANDIAKTYLKLKKGGLSMAEIETEIRLMYNRPKYAHLSRWNKVDKIGVFVDADLSREGGPKNYTIKNPYTKKPCIIPDRGWGKSHAELLKLQKEDLIYYGDEDTPPRMKVYIEEENNEMVPDSFMYFDNSIDTRMIKEMFGKLVFENPKPLELIKTILQMSTNKDDFILDSFAGSGTTAHAVLDLNKEDGKNRKFILVELEDGIAKKITAERVKRAIKKYNHKNGFEYCELAKPIFNEKGQINGACSYDELATYIYFTETQTNINNKVVKNPFIGESVGTSYYLIFKEKDKNDLTRSALSKLRVGGPAVIYADRCLVDEEELKAKGIIFKQIPYEIKVY